MFIPNSERSEQLEHHNTTEPKTKFDDRNGSLTVENRILENNSDVVRIDTAPQTLNLDLEDV